MSKRRRRKKRFFTKRSIYGIVVFATLILLLYYAVTFRNTRESVEERLELKAVIVDHLSLTVDKNLTKIFNETATSILKQADFEVDYIPGEKVTVNFYRDLPLKNYQLIILRVHSTAGRIEEEKLAPSFTVLFTSEPYDETKYIIQQNTGLLAKVYYNSSYEERGPAYFGITPKFVISDAYGMEGKFTNSTIILMGCEGLTNTETAQAFIQRGAKAYISWNATVSASHTDKATIHLLSQLLVDKQTIRDAIESTMKEVKSDPYYNSQLIFYPPEAGSFSVQSLLSHVSFEAKYITQDAHTIFIETHREGYLQKAAPSWHVVV